SSVSSSSVRARTLPSCSSPAIGRSCDASPITAPHSPKRGPIPRRRSSPRTSPSSCPCSASSSPSSLAPADSASQPPSASSSPPPRCSSPCRPCSRSAARRCSGPSFPRSTTLSPCRARMKTPPPPRPPRSRREAGDGAGGPDGSPQPSFWRRIATRVVRKPWLHLGAGIVILGVMPSGFIGSSIGLDQTEKFRVQSESAQGLDVLSEHFPPGESQPIWIVADTEHAVEVVDSVGGLDGVVRASAIAEATVDGASLTKILVIGEFEPDSAKGLELVEDIRGDVHAIDGADAEVGGAAATELDARDGNRADFFTIVPMVLVISFIILLGILRAPVAALTLLLVNVVSSAVAIGLGAFLSRTIFGQSALDAQVPILAFLFLVALGIDYSIFLAHRAKKESVVHGGRQGMVEAVAHTGGVITSAGTVRAGVFAALGMLPLMVLGQRGLT